MTGEQFGNTLNHPRTKRGDVITYHIGNLMHDRCYYVEADSVARAAYGAYKEGRVTLVQRRTTPTACVYMAVVL
jgi:hypothetical protein